MFGFKLQNYEEVPTFEDVLTCNRMFYYYFSCILNELDINIVENFLVWVLFKTYYLFMFSFNVCNPMNVKLVLQLNSYSNYIKKIEEQ